MGREARGERQEVRGGKPETNGERISAYIEKGRHKD